MKANTHCWLSGVDLAGLQIWRLQTHKLKHRSIRCVSEHRKSRWHLLTSALLYPTSHGTHLHPPFDTFSVWVSLSRTVCLFLSLSSILPVAPPSLPVQQATDALLTRSIVWHAVTMCTKPHTHTCKCFHALALHEH